MQSPYPLPHRHSICFIANFAFHLRFVNASAANMQNPRPQHKHQSSHPPAGEHSLLPCPNSPNVTHAMVSAPSCSNSSQNKRFQHPPRLATTYAQPCTTHLMHRIAFKILKPKTCPQVAATLAFDICHESEVCTGQTRTFVSNPKH